MKRQSDDNGLLDARADSIENARKRCRESLELQAKKMVKYSDRRFPAVKVGITVRVPIPDVDRARGSSRNLLAVVMKVENNFYKLCKNIVIKLAVYLLKNVNEVYYIFLKVRLPALSNICMLDPSSPLAQMKHYWKQMK